MLDQGIATKGIEAKKEAAANPVQQQSNEALKLAKHLQDLLNTLAGMQDRERLAEVAGLQELSTAVERVYAYADQLRAGQVQQLNGQPLQQAASYQGWDPDALRRQADDASMEDTMKKFPVYPADKAHERPSIPVNVNRRSLPIKSLEPKVIEKPVDALEDAQKDREFEVMRWLRQDGGRPLGEVPFASQPTEQDRTQNRPRPSPSTTDVPLDAG